MRCSLKYNKEQHFNEQMVEAWGEMQSVNDEPSYKESDLNKENALYFRAYKLAMDSAIGLFGIIHEEEELREEFEAMCAGDICMLLFSLLDEQGEEK
jgi:hypothetical protein